MKRLLIFAASLLMLSSCGFTGNRQGENSVEPQPVEKVPQVASTSEGADRSAVNLDEAKEVLKEILGSIAESMQKTDSTSVSEEPVEEEIPEKEPARELKWYEKDYSITVVDLDENVTYTYTRKEDVYYVDKEYGFIYEKKSSASGNVGVSFKDKSHFRVTAFTDKP